MTKEQVIELAEQAGLAFNSDEYPEIWQLYMHVGRDEITRFATLVRNAALEEAAQTCENRPLGTAYDNGRSCSIAIRSKKEISS